MVAVLLMLLVLYSIVVGVRAVDTANMHCAKLKAM